MRAPTDLRTLNRDLPPSGRVSVQKASSSVSAGRSGLSRARTSRSPGASTTWPLSPAELSRREFRPWQNPPAEAFESRKACVLDDELGEAVHPGLWSLRRSTDA